MSGLPPGWEWDYDGARWFYRYKPNGHVQFHFPKEGDEFPDFIDNFAPALELAPEEKLESQQQLKRRTTIDADPKSKMRATGGPLSDFAMDRSGFGGPQTNDDNDDGGFFFQPENFMYLGPSAYTDISPDADEDDRGVPSPKKAADDDTGGSNSKNKALLDAVGETSGVSPLQSETNTPSAAKSVPAQAANVVQELPLTLNNKDIPGPTNAAAASPDVPLLDSIEKPHPGPSSTFQPPPWDPVGHMAEMATEHTAPAHIETHPDPVEIADNTVLAPIETRILDFGIAELPERTSPSESRPPAQSNHDLLHQTNMSDKALYGATFGTGSRPQTSSQPRASHASPGVHPETVKAGHRPTSFLPRTASQETQNLPADVNNTTFAIKRKPSNSVARRSQYQPYVPGVTSSVTRAQPSREPNSKPRDHSNSLSREMSLMMGPRPKLDQESTPSVLQPPQVPPKVPFQPNQSSTPQDLGLKSLSMLPGSNHGPSAGTGVGQSLDGGSHGCLQHVPSVLKPARGQPQGQPQQSLPLLPYSATRESTNPRHTIPGTSPSSHPTSKAPTDRIVEKALQYTAFQPGGMNPQEPRFIQTTQRPALPQSQSQSLPTIRGSEVPLALRPQTHRVETAPPQSSTPLSHHKLSNRSAPALPDFLQRPRAQSDVRQQQGPSSQNRAYFDSAPNNVMRGAQSLGPSSPPTNPDLARQISYASSEVSSLGPPTGGQSSAPLQTPSPLESDGRRSSSGFLLGNHPDSSSRSTTGPAGQNAPLRLTDSRPASFSGPSPIVLPTEAAKQTTSQRRPLVPQKISTSNSASNIQQVPGQQTPGGPNSPASSRRHLLPPNNLASLGAQPHSQAAASGAYRASGQSNPQPHTPFAQVEWSDPGEETTKVAQNVSRPEPLPASQPSYPSENQSSVLSPPLGSQPPYPVEKGRPAIQSSSERPLRPKVIPPSQHTYGPTSPSTPIRSPGHVLHSIQEHLENDNLTGRAPAAHITQNYQGDRRYSQGSSLNLSSASAYPSSAESPRDYNAERLMNQVAQMQANVQKPVSQPLQLMDSVSLPSHPDYSPVAGNPFQPFSPINMGGSPLHNVMRPGSTPPVMQIPARDKDNGGWLAKFMKSNRASVVQNQPLPPPQQQQFQRLQHPPQVGPQMKMHNPHDRAGTHLHNQVVDKPAAPITAVGLERSKFDLVAPVPPILSTQIVHQTVSQSQSLDNPHQSFHSQNLSSHKKPSLAATSQRSSKSSDQQPNKVDERPISVPPVGSALPSGPPRDQTGDSLSDAASVSTMDVSEVQVQPVLKPHLVTVGKQAVVHSKRKQDSASQAATMQNSQLPYTMHRHNEAGAPVESELFVAPLFSKPNANTAACAAPVNGGPGPQDKWAKKPAVDYSGDDWGDDPWDYK
ncbi:hypothetical protein LY76DRAFT_525227 [Colletotrichum caudatum]|nr:hypothetical protein LY76DRAFT_525227 [Colletotrichum caudatum]